RFLFGGALLTCFWLQCRTRPESRSAHFAERDDYNWVGTPLARPLRSIIGTNANAMPASRTTGSGHWFLPVARVSAMKFDRSIHDDRPRRRVHRILGQVLFRSRPSSTSLACGLALFATVLTATAARADYFEALNLYRT